MQRAAVAGTVIAALAIAAAYASAFLPGGAPGWAPWLFVAGLALILTAVTALGAARTGRAGRALILPLAFIALVVAGGFGAVLLLAPVTPNAERLWLGLPTGAAIVLYAVGFLPVIVLPLTYALTFDSLTLSDEDIARVRAARRSPPAPTEAAEPEPGP